MADSPVLRKLLQTVAVKSLSRYDSKETGWHSESSKTQKIKVRGITVGSITLEAKTWVWLDDPAHSLTITITQFDLTNGRVAFGLDARAKARVWAWGKVPKIVTADVGGSAHVHLTITGSTQIAGHQLTNTEITTFDVSLSDLRFNNDALNAVSDLIQDSLNKGWFIDKGARVDDLKEAIDGVAF